MKDYKKWLYYAALTLVAGVFLFSTYRLILNQVEASRVTRQTEETQKLFHENNQINDDNKGGSESDDKKLPINEQFLPLLEINEDIVAWVEIDGMNIDFPVLQSDDNEYYLHRDLEKKDNLHGSIFLDYRNDLTDEVRHHILYGHNTKTMFEAILRYESQWNFDNHNIIEFDTIYHEGQQWEIFSAYFTDVSDNYIRTDFSSDEDFEEFINHLQDKSLHESEVELSKEDIILTLSTCTSISNDSRFAVHARLVK